MTNNLTREQIIWFLKESLRQSKFKHNSCKNSSIKFYNCGIYKDLYSWQIQHWENELKKFEGETK